MTLHRPLVLCCFALLIAAAFAPGSAPATENAVDDNLAETAEEAKPEATGEAVVDAEPAGKESVEPNPEGGSDQVDPGKQAVEQPKEASTEDDLAPGPTVSGGPSDATPNGPVAGDAANDETAAVSQSPGQPDLDKAMELKLLVGNRGDAGSTFRELNKIIELLDASIEKGLESENEEFARSMLVGTLMQRATGLSAAVLKRPKNSPASDMRWLQVRQFAFTDLQRVLEIDPTAANANLLFARLQLTQFGDPTAARRALGKVVEAPADAVEPSVRAQAYAIRAAAEPDATKRLADLTRAVELDPSKTEYLVARAKQLNQQKDYDAAMADLDAAIAIDPENPGVHELRALVLLAQDKPTEAIESFDRATELAPEKLSPYQFRGEAYNRLGDRQEAIKQLDKAIAIDPDNPGSRLVRSQLYLMDDRAEEALADVEAVLARQPGSLRAHLLRVQVLNKLGRRDDALESLDRIGEAAANRTEVLLQLALIYQNIGEIDESIETLSRVIDQDSENVAALRLRGDSYLTTGDHTSALADFARAYEIEPEDSGLLNNYAWTLATSPFDDLRDGERAIQLAEKAAELTNFEKPHIISTLAAAHAENGDFDRAVELAEKAVALEKEQQGMPDAMPDIDDQLSRELDSYRAGKPWRERQLGEDAPAELKPAADNPAETPVGDDPLDRAFDF